MSKKSSPGENKDEKKSPAAKLNVAGKPESIDKSDKSDKIGETEKTQQGGNP